jgi:1-acyl-sn-glycerol-3-phosphate acyltransferase
MTSPKRPGAVVDTNVAPPRRDGGIGHGESESTTEDVLTVVRQFAQDLGSRRPLSRKIDLDSALDADLGIDSLGRAELLHRLELAFRIRLPEDLLARAETVRDLHTAIDQAAPGGARLDVRQVQQVATAESAEATDADTLIDTLEWHAAAHPNRAHCILLDTAENAQTVTYETLATNAKRVAAGLRQSGLIEGDRVAIMLPTGTDFLYAFFGALYAGGVPVPLYPPVRMSHIEEHLHRQTGILKNAGATAFITVPAGLRLATLIKPLIPTLRLVTTVDSIRGQGPEPQERPEGSDPAVIQYTSGSTGDPKGVVLSHTNILSNIRAMGTAMTVGPDDVFISWLPLYHDMGLIGAWLGSLYYGTPIAMMSPLQFIVRPESWLWAIHRYRGTVTAAPNFAYELCLQNIDDAMIEGLDLSSLRLAVSGAEPVSPSTLRRFSARFAKFGFDSKALAPSYGLAESTVGLTCSPPGRGMIVDRIDRSLLDRDGKAVPASSADTNTVEIVACGRPLPGHQVRILDATGREAPDRQEGSLQFRGPSATQGYLNSDAQTRALFDDSWLNTGDLGYFADGDVFLTGRNKDLIIRAGRNIHPHEIEDLIGDIQEIRKGGVVVFGSADKGSGTERIVVAAETEVVDPAALEELRRKTGTAANDVLGMPPDAIVFVPPDSIPKTPSGKIRRAATRELFDSGRLGSEKRTHRTQLFRFWLRGIKERIGRRSRIVTRSLYAAYWWFVLVLLSGTCWLLVLAMPTRKLCWPIVHGCARLVLWATGISPDIHGENRRIPLGCVIVANHASYLDSLVLAAALRGDLTFVAKSELASQFVAGPFLRRIGALFVRRQDPEAGLKETDIAVQRAAAGETLVFFPEGTITRAPGLAPFRLGAFVVAAQAQAPVVPLSIRGTRSILRDGQWFPSRGPIEVTIGPPLKTAAADFAATVDLRDEARRFILDHCGEPSL